MLPKPLWLPLKSAGMDASYSRSWFHVISITWVVLQVLWKYTVVLSHPSAHDQLKQPVVPVCLLMGCISAADAGPAAALTASSAAALASAARSFLFMKINPLAGRSPVINQLRVGY